MKTETITRTVRLPLESSNRKTARARETIDWWQSIAKTVADHHPSFPEHQWGRTKQNPSFYRIVKREHPDSPLHSAGKLAAIHKVGDAFEAWRERGKPGHRPRFGGGSICRFTNQGTEVVANDQGYGIKISLEPYDPEWWHINAALYHREYLDELVDGRAKLGATELRETEYGLVADVAVSEEREVLEWPELTHVVGVDLGERVLYAAAVMAGTTAKEVVVESGREYRHYRERLKRKRSALMNKDDLRAVKSVRNQYQNYTDHITHTAATEVVSLADNYDRCGIAIEDLTGYREHDREEKIHDWPYAELQHKIMYKATEAGIPCTTVDPTNTSTTCRKCEHTSRANRDGREFACVRCGYEVHSDVNAAMQIAQEAG